MKSLKLLLIFLLSIVLGSCQFQSQKVTKNSLQTFFSYTENNEILISAHRGGKGYAGILKIA